MPKEIAVGDLNNDGRTDIAVIFSTELNVDIFYQNENGSFPDSPSDTIVTSYAPTGVDIGKMNSDALDDIVICYPVGLTGNIEIFHQQTGADKFDNVHLKQINLNKNPLALIVGMFDSDAYVDIAILSVNPSLPNSARLEIHPNSTSYTTTNNIQLSSMDRPNLICSGDYDNDGKLDIAVAETDLSIVQVYRNIISAPGDDTPWTTIFTFDGTASVDLPTSIEFVSTDVSGKPVLMIASSGNDYVLLFMYGTSSFATWSQIYIGSGVSYAKGMYLNEDTLEDIVVLDGSGSNITYYYTPSGSSLYGAAVGTFPCQNNSVQLETADMNEDGDEDLLLLHNRSATSGGMTLAFSIGGLLSNSNDNLWVQSQQTSIMVGRFSRSSQIICVFDNITDTLKMYDGASWHTISLLTSTADKAVSLQLYDSYDDIVLTDPDSNTVVIFYSSTSIFSSYIPRTLAIPSLSSPTSVTSAYVNDDGLADLVVGCEGGFVIFYNDGTVQGFRSDDPVYYDVIPLATIPDVQWTMTGNFNNGTDQGAGVDLIDIAVINSTTNRIEIYFQQTDGSFSTMGSKMHSLSTPSGTIIWANTADVNSDGLVDIVIATDDGNIVAYLQRSNLLLGFSNLGSDRVIFNNSDGVSTAAVGDYDDDGFSEIAVIGSDLGSASLIHLSGSVFKVEYSQIAGAGDCNVAIGDVDGDGKDDLVVGSPGSGAVSIWYQRNIAPHADWYSETTVPTEGISTVLNAIGSWDSYSDNGSLSYTWKWRLSGGVTWIDITTASSSPTVSYAFPSWGLYEVSLMVSDGDGGIDWLNKTVRVKDGMPTAGFDYSGTLVEGMNITFTDSSTSPVDEITYFRWDFDDGTPQLILSSNETPVVHRFLSNGVYDVTLTVRDGDLNESVFYRTITIDDSDPQFTISKSLATINEGDTVTFSAVVESPDAVVYYHWSIENGTRLVDGASSSVAHQFLTNGRFYVNLTIDESDGDSSTSSILIVVLDSIPTASFTMSDTQVDEGEPVTLQDTSTAYDGIASRYWQFGNGKTSTAQSPIISYEAHGNYTVTLWVMDSDGDNISITRTISVSDTNPEITSPLVTSTGERNFTKGEEVSFTITVDPGAEMPVYSWTITSSSSTTYTTFTDGPSLSYTFTKAGSYHIVIRVSDSDRYFEESTDVRIIDQEPTAKMRVEHVNIDLLTVTLSANMTQDPDDDLASLLFSWNYGDGSDWTPWTSYGIDGGNYAFHTYAEPGIYTATLRVKDPVTTDYNEITITLDKWAPEVEADIVTGSYVGDPIQIDARVIDDIGVTVRLFYSFNGTVFTSVLMTPSDDLGNYSGQIPTPNDTGTIWYYISATDDNNNTYTTDTNTIKVEVEPSMLYIWLAMLFVACFLVLTLIFFSRTKPVVDEVFVIYHDGNLIAHQTRRLKPGMDDQILGSMFVALQGFVKDSFKDESSTMLKRMDFGEKKVMVEKGDFIYIAVVLNGKRTDSIPPRMQKVLEDIDKEYGIDLIAWDGDLESLRGVRDLTQPLFERVGFLDLSGRKGRKKNA